MADRVTAPFKPLFGVSFYDARPIKSDPESENYRLGELLAEELPWEWYFYYSLKNSPDDPPHLVRAFRLTHPMRILASSREMELPEGKWLIHDGQIIYSEDHVGFELMFLHAGEIISSWLRGKR